MTVGLRVDRVEDRLVTGATVLEIDNDMALIAYDEGGQGWWPASLLVPL